MKKAYKETKKTARADVVKFDKPTQDEAQRVQTIRDIDDHTQATRLFQSASDSRKRFDWEWLTRDLYRRGYQFTRYNATNKTVTLSSRSKVKVAINLVNAQLRVIRNQITSFRPKWETLPRGSSEEATNNARYSGKLLDYYFDKFNLRMLSKKCVTQGLTYSIGGPWQIGYDPDGDNGNGEVYIWGLDTYDFYVDPHCTKGDLSDAEYVFKAVRKSLVEIKADPEYSVDEKLRGDPRLASSEYKQFLLQALSSIASSDDNEEEEGAILKEMWLKMRVTDENKKEILEGLRKAKQDTKELALGETVMKVVSYLDSVFIPLKVQYLRRNDFPFVLYVADVEPTTLYGEGWMKHVIPMNRVLNALESSVFTYNYRYAKGRLAVQKNSGVRIVTNEHGDIVEYNPGTIPPTAIPLNPLQQSYPMQIENMRKYIEDIGGAHDVSFGRIPAGVKSGVGIAELKSADFTNQNDLVDSFSDFLVEVGKKVLNEIAQNYDVPKLIKVLGKGGSPDHFAIVGEEAAKGRKNKKEVKIGADVFDIAVIGKDSEIRVTIGSWLAHTKSAREEKLKEYFQIGAIDQQTFLEHMEFADIDDIVEKTRKEEALKKFRGQPAQPGMPSDEEIAEQENVQMTHENKTPDALPEDNHQVHLIVHQEALGSMGNPLVEAHMAQHEDFIKQGREQQVNQFAGLPQQLPPQTPPPGSPPEISPEMGGLPPEMNAMPTPGTMMGGSPEALIQGLMG